MFPGAASAQGQPPFQVRLGSTDVTAVVRDRPSPTLEVRAGRAVARAEWPIGLPVSGTFERVDLRSDASVAILGVSDAAGRRANAVVGLLRGRPKVLWIARTDPRGDPGERMANVVRVDSPRETGLREVLVGIESDTHRICDDTPLLLEPRRLDPAAGTFSPEATPIPAIPVFDSVTVVTASPGPQRPPRLAALVPRAATSIAGHDDGPPPRPFGIADGDLATAWIAGVADGRGETIITRFPAAPLPIRALAIVPVPTDAAVVARTQPPRRLWIVGDRAPSLQIELPADPTPGQRLWIVPREPMTWSCVSLILDDPAEVAPTRPVAIAELEAYTDLDFEGGLARLVDALDGSPAIAREAGRWLGTLGADAVAAIADRVPTLGPTGRRRAMRALGGLAKRHPGAAEALASLAGESEDGETIDEAVGDLVEAGAPAAASVRGLVLAGGVAGDRAARVLARRRPEEAIAVALEAIRATGGTERRALRESFTLAARAAPDAARSALADPSAAAPDADVAAAIALAASASGDALDEPARAVHRIARQAEEFAPRFRAIRAARRLGPDPAIDAWLEGLVTRGDPWMLRAEALDALRARDARAAKPLAAAAIEDAYPRVRAVAIGILGDAPATLARVAWLARRDPWPFVRARAAAEIVTSAGGRAVVRAAATDHAARVRAAALVALEPYASDDRAWDSAKRRLEQPREAREVLLAGVRLARARCRDDVVPVLDALVRKAAARDGEPDDAEVALAAIEALGRLATATAREALKALRAGPSEPALRQAIDRSLATEERCDAGGAGRSEASGP